MFCGKDSMAGHTGKGSGVLMIIIQIHNENMQLFSNLLKREIHFLRFFAEIGPAATRLFRR